MDYQNQIQEQQFGDIKLKQKTSYGSDLTIPELNLDGSYPYQPVAFQECTPLDAYHEMYLTDLLSHYWVCPDVFGMQPQMQFPYYNQEPNFMEAKSNKAKVLSKENQERKLCQLLRALEEITNSDAYIVTQTKKIQRRNVSTRRSAYIGVSRNGPNWQSMISLNKRKSYIGTYSTENEAAYAFDYYSLLIHGLSAKTNFNYTKNEVYDLIQRFKE